MFRRTITRMATTARVPRAPVGASGNSYQAKDLLQVHPVTGRIWTAM